MVVFSDFGFSLEWFTRRLYRLDFIKEIKKKSEAFALFWSPASMAPFFSKVNPICIAYDRGKCSYPRDCFSMCSTIGNLKHPFKEKPLIHFFSRKCRKHYLKCIHRRLMGKIMFEILYLQGDAIL